MDPWDKAGGKAGGNALDQAQANVSRIQTFIKHLHSLTDEIGSENDTTELRDRLHQISKGRKATSALIKETTAALKQPYAGNDKLRADKLKRTLHDSAQEYERLAQDSQRREREILVQMEQQFEETYGSAPPAQSYQSEARSRGRTKLALELSHGMEEADIQIINERNAEVQMLDHELEDVVDLMQEVNELTADQGVKLDQAAETVKMSEETVSDTQQELSRFYRCCGCCCVKAHKAPKKK